MNAPDVWVTDSLAPSAEIRLRLRLSTHLRRAPPPSTSPSHVILERLGTLRVFLVHRLGDGLGDDGLGNPTRDSAA